MNDQTGPAAGASRTTTERPPYGPELASEPGWFGLFTRQQAEGAIPNGTRVVKVSSGPGDAHPVGTCAAVLGSLKAKVEEQERIMYFVEWDDAPRTAVGVADHRIAPVQSDLSYSSDPQT